MEGNETEELESFRQQWRREVSARTKGQSETSSWDQNSSGSGPGRPVRKGPPVYSPSRPFRRDDTHDYELQSFHDLDDKEESFRLQNEVSRPKTSSEDIEPQTALEHYEMAVERESQGKLGDSVALYRMAFRLDDKVQQLYKTKHFPPSSLPPKTTKPNPSNAAVTVSNPAHHSLDGPPPDAIKLEISDLIESFSNFSIPPAEPETDLSDPPPCPIACIPEEVLAEILQFLAVLDFASFGRSAWVCKRFAYLIAREDKIWKRLAQGSEVGFAGMHYTFTCNIRGRPLLEYTLLDDAARDAGIPLYRDLTPSTWLTYRSQLRHRPRIRFSGCYISTVNYARPGAPHQSRFNWTSPIQIVTYYRYLRFFRDGTAISLLTAAEPANVVHHLTKENLHEKHTGALPSAVMKDALRGRWRLSGTVPYVKSVLTTTTDAEVKGPGEYLKEPSEDLEEEEGDLHVETEGVIPKYMWRMQFAVGSAGRKDGTRNNKLSWKGFWSYNRLTDDWGEFGLKNDRAYYWSRVKSYGKAGSL